MNKGMIIAEIQRTAAANGGTPLGWKRFIAETGVQERDWKRYWARWSEALQEAGLAANRLTTPYTDDEMLHALADLAVTIGRLPTDADMRFATNSEHAVPSDRTFRKRWPRRADLLSALGGWCRGRQGFESVEAAVLAVPAAPTPADPELASAPVAQDGYVYLKQFRREFKIGWSRDPLRRQQEIGRQLPDDLVIVHVILTDDPTGIEAYWHKRFAAKRAKGEWFALTQEDVRAFKRRKFM